MSEIQGTGIINELVMTIPVGSKPRREPSVVLGQSMGSSVANFYHTIMQDDLYSYFYLNKVMSGSVMDFGDLLDGEGEELY